MFSLIVSFILSAIAIYFVFFVIVLPILALFASPVVATYYEPEQKKEEKTSLARDYMVFAVIGLVIVLLKTV